MGRRELATLGHHVVLFSILPDRVHVVLHLRDFFRVEADLLPYPDLLREEYLMLGVVVAVGLGEALADPLLLNLYLVVGLDKLLKVALQPDRQVQALLWFAVVQGRGDSGDAGVLGQVIEDFIGQAHTKVRRLCHRVVLVIDGLSLRVSIGLWLFWSLI